MDDNPWPRIEAIIRFYGFRSTNAFALHIGLSRAENLYRIKRGKNGISRRLAATICDSLPDVNHGWLLSGDGRMFLKIVKS